MDILVKRPNLLFLIAIRRVGKIPFVDIDIREENDNIVNDTIGRGYLMPLLAIVCPKLREDSFYDRYMTEYTVYEKYIEYEFEEDIHDRIDFINLEKKISIIHESWTVMGMYHRKNGPAQVISNYVNLSTDGKPSVLIVYQYNGEGHRLDGPAITEESYYVNSTILKYEYHVDGKLHRLGGPAFYMQDEDTITEKWMVNGEHHRDDGPAVVEKSLGTPGIHVTAEEKWYQHGKLHRKDGPAVTYWSGDIITQRSWYKKGKLHRGGDKPAVIKLLGKRLQTKLKRWMINGKLTRTVKHKGRVLPAVISKKNNRVVTKIWAKDGWTHSFKHKGILQPGTINYDKRGKVKNRSWYKNGDYHRENGPAIIDNDGGKEWYMNGQIIKKVYPRKVIKAAKKGKMIKPKKEKLLDELAHQEISEINEENTDDVCKICGNVHL